uniref:Immunoglobulin superfamily member 9 n=2 Tax=Malurus TaxID=55806 RepID=A0A8C5ULA3_9PASS
MSPPVHRHRCADGAVTNPHAWQCEAGSLGTGTERGAPGQGERERVDHGRGWPEGMAREGVARGMGCTGEGGMGGGGTGGGDPEYRTDPDVPVVTHTGRVRLEEGASLRLELLRPEDQGWYECRVLFLDRHSSDADFRNGTWIHLSSGVSFSHPSPTPPTFLETPPALVEVRVRSALTLTCRAAGNPQPVVTWRRSDRPVQSGAVTNGTLTIAAVGRASAGTYTCHAASKEGTATHSTRVLVQGPPVIVVPPQNVTVNVSQDAFLACQAEAYPGNLTYSWFRGGSNVFHLSHLQSRVRVLVDGSLLLQRATPDDAGRYTCTPSNGLWEPPSASAFITVLYPAEVTAMLPETPLPKGMRGVIRCPARANPPLLRVSWTKDGRPLEVDKLPGWSVRPDGSIVIATGNDDAPGLYRCTPYNSYGTAGESRPTRVLLKDPPAFTVQPKEEYFQEVGRELVIPCAAGGDPPPVVTWGKVRRGPPVSARVDSNGSLVLHPLSKEQHGLWECTATNQVATVTAVTSVHVLGTSPHAVTNVSVRPLPLAANISWEPGFDGGYFQRFSVWYTPLAGHPPRAHHDWVSLPVPPGSRHLLVANLQPDTGYQFSVLAQNKLGSGPFSQIVTSVPRGFPVTTVPPEPPATSLRVFLWPPRALRANETVRGVLLRWEPPGRASVAPSGYALELRQDRGGWEVLERSIPATDTQLLVPGLIKDAFYEFRLVALAGSYISEPSNAVNVSTAGMEVYPSRTQLPELLPQPVLAGVIGGICFLSVAVIFSTTAACIMNRRRAARLRKRHRDPPLVFSPSKNHTRRPASPESAVKLKPQPSPYRSLQRTLLWGEKAGTSLGHGGHEQHVPLERICRGPDGRFVLDTEPRPEPQPDPPRDLTPPAPAVSPGPPAISGILQYLSLPFFKEMCVDGDWPPPEEPAEPAGACPDHCRVPRAPPAAPRPRQGLAARFPAWPRSSSARLKARGGRWTLRARRGSEGSLTSQSSGRGRLRPPSVAPSLLGGTAGHRLGAGAAGTARLGRREGRAGWTPAGGRGEEGRQGGRGGDGMGWGLDGMGWIWIYRIYGIYGWNLGGTGRGWRDWDGYDLDLWDDGLYGIYGWNLGRDRWDGMGWDGMGWDGMGGMGLGWAGMALCTLGTLPAVPVPGIGMGLGRDWDGMGFMGFGMGWDLDGWDGMVDGMGWTGCCGRD